MPASETRRSIGKQCKTKSPRAKDRRAMRDVAHRVSDLRALIWSQRSPPGPFPPSSFPQPNQILNKSRVLQVAPIRQKKRKARPPCPSQIAPHRIHVPAEAVPCMEVKSAATPAPFQFVSPVRRKTPCPPLNIPRGSRGIGKAMHGRETISTKTVPSSRHHPGHVPSPHWRKNVLVTTNPPWFLD